MNLIYNYNSKEYEITMKQYNSLMEAISLYNECIDGTFDEPDISWNIKSGVHFGIIADCYYKKDSNGMLYANAQVIVDHNAVLNVRIAANGLFSIWCRAYRNFKHTDSFGDGSELVGELIKFTAENRVYGNNNEKMYTSITRLRFVPEKEYDIILDAVNVHIDNQESEYKDDENDD